jgi:membrane-associated phospholipid phosphatase
MHQRLGARPLISAVLARLLSAVARLLAFALRHPWSIGLSLGSLWFFIELASEVREGELGPIDDAVAAVVMAGRGRFDAPMLALTEFGSGIVMASIATIAVVVSLLRGRRTEALFLFVATAGTGLLNIGLKLFFQRARPDATVRYLIDAPGSFSFPSGHAMGTGGVLASLVILAFVSGLPKRLRVPLALLAAGIAAGVALSRVYLGIHYPSDVLGGLLGACAWVSAVTGVFYPRLLPGERATEQTHEAVVEKTQPES